MKIDVFKDMHPGRAAAERKIDAADAHGLARHHAP